MSESVYRLSQAAKSGKAASEDLRLAPPPRRRRRGGVVPHPRPAARGRRAATGAAVWTVSDETREHDRHETFFQDLQHAIDYLDHAPAGFFSAEPDGAIVHMNATLAEWLDYDLAQFGLGQLKVGDIIAGDGGAMLTTMSGRPGEVKTQPFDVDLKPRQGRVLPARILHKVAFSSDGAPGPSRSLVISRAPGEVKGEEDLRAAEVRLRAHLQLDPGRHRRGRGRRRAAAPQRRLRPSRARRAEGRRRRRQAVDLQPGRRARPRRARAPPSRRPPRARAGSSRST